MRLQKHIPKKLFADNGDIWIEGTFSKLKVERKEHNHQGARISSVLDYDVVCESTSKGWNADGSCDFVYDIEICKTLDIRAFISETERPLQDLVLEVVTITVKSIFQ